MLRSLLQNACRDIQTPLPALYQIVRWKRKPRKPFWLGTAPSKRFIIHNDPILPPEERAELLRLHANYKTSMKSIRSYFMSQHQDIIEAQSHKATPEDIEASIAINDAWNTECAAVRNERLQKQQEAHAAHSIRILERAEQRQVRFQEKVESVVRAEKDQSTDFVTRENLDEKIEECLSREVDFNFAIDLEGNMYTGYEDKMTAAPLELSQSSRIVQKN